MTDRSHITLYSGGHKGAESEFGRLAQAWGIPVDLAAIKAGRWRQPMPKAALPDLEAGIVVDGNLFIFERI